MGRSAERIAPHIAIPCCKRRDVPHLQTKLEMHIAPTSVCLILDSVTSGAAVATPSMPKAVPAGAAMATPSMTKAVSAVATPPVLAAMQADPDSAVEGDAITTVAVIIGVIITSPPIVPVEIAGLRNGGRDHAGRRRLVAGLWRGR